jgi:hypothetical protein
LPGILAAIAALTAAVWQGIDSVEDPTFEEQLERLLAAVTGMELHWLLLAVAITTVSVLLPLRLVRPPRDALF